MGALLHTLMALATLLNFFLYGYAIDSGCDFRQQLAMGQKYYIYNKEYPNNYGSSVSCRWSAESPAGTAIVLSCDEINIPSSTNCQGDRLAVSLTGNANFNDAHNYCGKGSITLITESNKLVVGLFSQWNTVGGNFVCTLTAIQQSEPTTTTESPSSCDCGWERGTRIVGGTETGVNQYPLMGVLVEYFPDDGSSDLFCGASIIHERYGVTAAHCFHNRNMNQLGILVGDHNVSSSTDTSYAAAYKIQSAITHELYNDETQANDIALLITAQPMKFSAFVGPVCLPFKYSGVDFANQAVTALGYGFQDFSGPKSDVLEKVDLTVVPNPQCMSELPQNQITYKQICTYGQGKDTCFADSGGPLLYKETENNRLYLVGLTSYGIGCATQKPSVDTRITSYLTWIVQHSNGAQFCIK